MTPVEGDGGATFLYADGVDLLAILEHGHTRNVCNRNSTSRSGDGL
jgi:hypothetical protein